MMVVVVVVMVVVVVVVAAMVSIPDSFNKPKNRKKTK